MSLTISDPEEKVTSIPYLRLSKQPHVGANNIALLLFLMVIIILL